MHKRLLASALSLALVLHAHAGDAYTVSPDKNGAWSFVSPAGERIYSLGINSVNPEPWSPRPNTTYYNPLADKFKGDATAWASSAREIMRDAGLNTLGSWSSPKMPAQDGLYQTIMLYVAGADSDRCLASLRPGFEDLVRKNTREMIAKYAHPDRTLGVFLDNEMPWYGKTAWDKLPTFTLLERAFQQPESDPARTAAIAFLKDRYPTPQALGEAFGQPLGAWSALTREYLQTCTSTEAARARTDFTTLAARKFYEGAARVVREELPGVLILGSRFAGDAPDAVIEACGRVSDVVSFNAYVNAPASPRDLIARYWILTHKPLMLTEFAWRAKENQSANPNSRGAGTVVMTQVQRAANYKAFMLDLLTEPVVIGAHWFEWADQSPQGRFDGEDSNYGIVDIKHGRYDAMIAAMHEVSGQVASIRAGTLKPVPTEAPAPKRVTYSPGQHPERPPTLDLFASPVRPPETWTAPDASVSMKPESAGVSILFDVGSQWGAGLNLFGPANLRLDKGPADATDLDGYADIVVEFEAPKGLQINLTLHEAGAAAPGQPKYDSAGGDDGESFSSAPFFGAGARRTQRVPIASLLPESGWGNQNGARRIDMNSIRTIGLQFQGTPQRGVLKVLAYRLEK